MDGVVVPRKRSPQTSAVRVSEKNPRTCRALLHFSPVGQELSAARVMDEQEVDLLIRFVGRIRCEIGRDDAHSTFMNPARGRAGIGSISKK